MYSGALQWRLWRAHLSPYTLCTSSAQAWGLVELARSHSGDRLRFLESHRRNGAELWVNE